MRAPSFLTQRRVGLSVACLALVWDMATKTLILQHVDALPVKIIPSFFALILAWNPGVAFSFLADISGDWLQIGLMVFALGLCGIFTFWLGQYNRWTHQVGLGLIIGGALGNVWDRFQHGAVVDFLLFYWDTWYFPAFNLADSAITVGVGLMLLDHVLDKKKD